MIRPIQFSTRLIAAMAAHNPQYSNLASHVVRNYILFTWWVAEKICRLQIITWFSETILANIYVISELEQKKCLNYVIHIKVVTNIKDHSY